VIYSYNRSQQDALFLNFILIHNSISADQYSTINTSKSVPSQPRKQTANINRYVQQLLYRQNLLHFLKYFYYLRIFYITGFYSPHMFYNLKTMYIYRGADKSLARPGRKQAVATKL